MARKPANQTVSREEILSAAAHVFRLSGYHGATMQDIGNEVGLRQNSLYHYFPSKRELLLTLLNVGLERLTQVVSDAACPDLPPDARLSAAIAAYLCCVAQYPDVALVTITEARALLDEPEDLRAYIAHRDELERLFAAIIREGIEQGLFRPVDISLTVKMLFSVHNWFVVWYRPDGRLSAPEISQIMAEFFLAGLRPVENWRLETRECAYDSHH